MKYKINYFNIIYNQAERHKPGRAFKNHIGKAREDFNAEVYQDIHEDL